MRSSALFSQSVLPSLGRLFTKAAPALLGLLAWNACAPLASAATPTTTTLAVTAAGSPVSSVASATVVTLTATVQAGTTPVTPGLVKFCDASAAHCTDIHLLGTAQLTATGTATFRFRPGIGSHSYNAIFAGTTAAAASTSAVAPLVVTGTYKTTTTIAQAGTQSNYTLTATVTGLNAATGGPTGTVPFLDTTGNSTLGTASLGVTSAGSQSFYSQSTGSIGYAYPIAIVSADFNGDGIPDVAVPGYGEVQVLLGKGDGTFTALTPTALPNTTTYYNNLAVADFNGDGIADLVVTDNAATTAAILLGKGDGTFSVTSSPTIGMNNLSIAIGDFNGDGIADIAIASTTLQILLGNGDGTFTVKPQTSAPFASGISQLSVGDFNGDGIQDLIAATTFGANNVVGPGDITVLTGNGDGTFTLGSSFTIPGADPSVAVGDLDGDGIMDLVVTSIITTTQTATGTLTTFRGNGNGTFTSLATLNLPTAPVSIAMGDLNGDGIPDVVTTEEFTSLIVSFGNGNGTFTLGPAPSVAQYSASSIAVVDLNGDGVQDIVTGSGTGGGSVTTLLNQISRMATAPLSNVSVPGRGTHAVLASYPGDSAFAASTSATTSLTATPANSYSTTLALTSSQNPATFGSPVTLTATITPSTFSGATTDGDPISFFTLGQSIGTGTLSGGTATLTLSNLPPGTGTITATFPGDNNFVPATSNALVQTVQVTPSTSLAITSGGNPVTTVTAGTVVTITATVSSGGALLNAGQVAFCDASAAYCNDIHLLGTAQILPNGTASLKFIPSAGAHSYKAITTVAGARLPSSTVPLTVTAGLLPTTTTLTDSTDPTGTTLTATVAGLGGKVPPTGTVAFADITVSPQYAINTATLGTGTVTPQLTAAYSLPDTSIPVSFTVADFNGDGISDFFVTTIPSSYDDPNAPTGSYVLLGQGDGINFRQVTGPALPNPCTSIATADFNGDGNADVAAFLIGASAPAVLLGKGDGTFTTTASLSATGCSQVIAGDFNKDGRTDLAVLGTSPGQITLWLGNGNGTFTAMAPISLTGSSLYLLSGDFNGDTNLDLAVLDGAGNLSVLLNNGDGTFQSPVVTTGSSTGSSISGFAVTADLNADGRTDVAIAAANGLLTVLLGNADGTFTFVAPPTVTVIPTPTTSNDIAIGDFNGDGKVDLVVDAYLFDGSTYDGASAKTFLGNGDGTFTAGPTQSAPTGNRPGYLFTYSTLAVASADFNGDGLSDVVIGVKDTNDKPGYGTPIIGVAFSFLSQLAATASASTHVVSFPNVPSSSAHTVTATYGGDAIYNTSTGTDVVVLTPSILTLSANINSITYGTPVVFTVHLNPYNAQGLSTNGELIIFTNGTTTLGTAALSNGTATFTSDSLPVGQASVSATYTGDGNFAPASAPPLAITVSSGSYITFNIPTIHTYGNAPFSVLATSPSPSAITYSVVSGPATISGSTVTITGAGTVVLQASQAATSTYLASTQTATFTVNKAPLTLTAANGARVFGAANPAFTGTLTGAVNGDTFTETFSTAATAASIVGSYPIVPSASGTKLANYTIAATNGALTISQAGTATTFALSNQNTTLTATVAALTSGVPTGSVSFYEGQTSVGTGTLVNGSATVTTTSFPAGDVVVSAQYSGDVNFTQSASPPILVLSVTPASTSLSVPQAGSVTDTITLSPAPGYTGTVQFSCSGLPQNATCSFQPSSFKFDGSISTTSVTTTIQTGVTAQAGLSPYRSPSTEGRGGLLAAALCGPGLLVFCVAWRRGTTRTLLRSLVLPLLLLGCTAMLFTACSSGGSTSTTSNSSTQTPTGSFTVNLNVSGSNGLSQTTSLHLTVH